MKIFDFRFIVYDRMFSVSFEYMYFPVAADARFHNITFKNYRLSWQIWNPLTIVVQYPWGLIPPIRTPGGIYLDK